MAANDTAQEHGYVLGHSPAELARLEQQAAFFAEMTRDGLVRAGVAPGMRVLDLGCGVGDVSLIAASLVGPTGKVTGIDISEGAVGIARARAAASGVTHARFEQSRIDAFAGYGDYDVVVGRYIVIHIPDPVGMLRDIVGKVKKDTVLAFMEMDMSTTASTVPVPLFEQSMQRIMDVYKRLGSEPDTGSKLYSIFRAAGLEPQLTGSTRVGNRLDLHGIAFLAESVRSLLPAMEKLGIATAADVDIDTLRQRLAAEITAADPCIFFPRFVAGWARS